MLTNRHEFVKPLRLKRSEDFQQAFRRGNKFRRGCITVYARPNGLGHARLGLAITKKTVPNATTRNRLKRVIRESFRLNQWDLLDLDIVIVVAKHDFSNKQVVVCDLEKQWSRLAIYYKKA